ncbi:MAG: Gldg family protein [Nitrospirota bacterium]|nr:Gldg family protein [Nitrospirota bacterium]MDH5587771.1 Gldg family protein [Nitrospirota bacterium]MDH5776245.1 Gldg family protein [Nitrospirota bacterium]
MNKRLLTGTGIALAAVLFGAFNMMSNAALRSARFDLTDHKLYTLSDGTKNVLANLTEPITLRFYLSKKLATGLPGIKGYATRVQEMLEEYAQVAGSQLVLQVMDPEPFSEEEDRAVAYGLQGIPLDNGSTQFYFGLAGTSSTDELEVVPFFQPEREEFLEYDLTKMIHSLANPKKKVLGLISSLPIDGAGAMPMMQQGGGSPPWLIVTHIEQMFEIKKIEPTATTIPEDVSVLMIVHPKRLGDPTLYAIDQFVLQGGHTMIFVDPLAESDRGGGNPMNPMGGEGPRNSDLPKLFDAWGLEMVQGKVLGDLPLAKKVQIQQQARMQVVDYPVWVDFRQEHFSGDDIVTAQVPAITMASAGILQRKGDVGTELTPLIQSDEAAMKIDASTLSFMPDLGSILSSYKPEGIKMMVAARVTGKVKTAFPDGKPNEPVNEGDASPAPQSDAKDKPHVAESTDPINVIVVADTDILQDKFWAQVQNFFGQRIGIPTSGNGTFVTNALDNLTGSNDLISVRSRAGYSRPFTLLRALQQDAEQQFRQKEQALQERLKGTERKLQELQSQKSEGSAMIMSAEQQTAMATFRQDLVQVRKELRAVQHELGKNIESVESWVKFINIGLVPVVIGIVGVWFSSSRLRKKSK